MRAPTTRQLRRIVNTLGQVFCLTWDRETYAAAQRIARALVVRGVEPPQGRALLAAARAVMFVRLYEEDRLAARAAWPDRVAACGGAATARAALRAALRMRLLPHPLTLRVPEVV